MRNIFTIAAVSVLSVTTAVAETAPSDVAFQDGSVMASLTGTAGDASAGRKTFIIANWETALPAIRMMTCQSSSFTGKSARH